MQVLLILNSADFLQLCKQLPVGVAPPVFVIDIPSSRARSISNLVSDAVPAAGRLDLRTNAKNHMGENPGRHRAIREEDIR
jgi:hypothetical protein